MVDFKKLHASMKVNVAVGKAAREWMELLDDVLAGHPGVDKQKVMQRACEDLAASCSLALFKEVLARDMTEQQAKAFEHELLKFGKHKGEEVRDVPTSYLEWLLDDDFMRDVRLYVKTERFKRRKEQRE